MFVIKINDEIVKMFSILFLDFKMVVIALKTYFYVRISPHMNLVLVQYGVSTSILEGRGK